MKKIVIAMLMAVFALPAAADTKYYGVATGNVKGAWYAGGHRVATSINSYREMSMTDEDVVWVAVPTRGSLQNAVAVANGRSVKMTVPGVDGKVTVQIKAGFIQPDVRAYVSMHMGIPSSSLQFAVKGGTECIWTAVDPNGRVDDMDSLQDTDGATMVVGAKGSGMDTSLLFLKLQDKEIRSVAPINSIPLLGMNAMSAKEDLNGQGVPDSVSFVMSPAKAAGGDLFTTAKSLGLTFIDMDDNQFNNEVEEIGGKAPYEFQTHRTPTGRVTVPCMDSSLYVGQGVDIGEVVQALAGHAGRLF